MAFALCFAMSLFVLLPITAVRAQAATRLNILMIGNSLTYSGRHKNTTISKLRSLGSYSGYSFNIRYIAYGGEKLETYANSRKKRGREAENLINSQTWDIVVLQQETDSAFLRASSFENSAKILAGKIRRKSPRARIIMNCTWAYNKKKRGLSHSVQQQRMNANYRKIASKIRADVIWSGNAFDNYRWGKGPLSLYKSDKNHASEAGCYLNACCLYAGITRRSPYGIGYYGRWGKARGSVMQKTAMDANRALIKYR